MVYIPSFNEILKVSADHGRFSDAPHLWEDLAGAWPLQEGGGLTAFDVSGNGNHGTLVDGPTHVVGERGRALEFAGAASGHKVVFGSVEKPLNGTIAISCWWKINTFDAEPTPIVLSYGNYGLFVNTFAANRIEWRHTQVAHKSTAAVAGRWYHSLCVHDVQDFSHWLDLDLQETEPDEVTDAITLDSLSESGNELNGQVALVAAWLGRIPSLAEIAQLYADPWAMYREHQIRLFSVPKLPYVSDSDSIDLNIKGYNDSAFTINSSTGQITVDDASGFEVGQTWTLTVKVTDDSSNTDTEEITVTLIEGSTNSASGTTDATASLSGVSKTETKALASVNAVASLSGTALSNRVASSSINVLPSLTGVGSSEARASASLSAIATLQGTAKSEPHASSTTTAVASLVGTSKGTSRASATTSATLSITALSKTINKGSSSIAVESELTGYSTSNYSSYGVLYGSGSIEGVGRSISRGSSIVDGVLSLEGVGGSTALYLDTSLFICGHIQTDGPLLLTIVGYIPTPAIIAGTFALTSRETSFTVPNKGGDTSFTLPSRDTSFTLGNR